MKKIFIVFISIILSISISLDAGSNKFASEIIICSKRDSFSDYQVRKTVFTEAFLLNKLLRKESPETVIKLNIDETLKNIKFDLDRKKRLLTVFLNDRLIAEKEDFFKRELIKYMIISEYSQGNDFLKDAWIFQGCWSFIRKNIHKSPNSKEAFPFAKMLLFNGIPLSVKSIINFDTDLGSDLFEMYYSEVSELLILTITDFPRGRDILNEYIKNLPLSSADRYAFFGSLLTKYGYGHKQIEEALNLQLKNVALSAEQPSDKISLEINEYLHDVERDKIPFGKRYSIYFAVLEKNPDLLRIIWPQLDAFLNKEYPMKL